VLQSEAISGMAVHKELRGALPIGSRLFGYELAAVLGQGTFGITYRARDSKLARDVAIKEYLPTALALREGGTTVVPRSTELAGDFAWGRERFLEEARTLAKLGHAPSIVRVHDFLEANGTAYMVMELVTGETLEQRIKRNGRLSSSAIRCLLYPLLDGLEQVHEAGFLHRDIKPANIILDGKGQPTLIDFGAARAAVAGHTATMTAVFTPGYAAAEQFASGKQGPWTDIYGLSATLYHAITGETLPNAIDRTLDDAYCALIKRAPSGYPSGLLTGVDAGLAVRAIDRPQDIASWRPMLFQTTDLKVEDGTIAICHPSVPSSPIAAPAVPASSKQQQFPLWVGAAGAVAAVALLAGGGFFVAKESQRGSQQATVDKPADDARLASEAQRLRDEQELAKLRDEAARLKAGQEASQRRQIEEEERRKAEADLAIKQREAEVRRKATAEAEVKRKADEAAQADRKRAEEAAARQQAEAEARQRAEDDSKAKTEAAARAEADAAMQKKSAEAAESALNLTSSDRQRLQVALSSLGFGTRGNDGVLGPRSREAIAAWQRSKNLPATGFIDANQQQTLLNEGAEAIRRFDQEQKRADEERKRSEEARKAGDDPAPQMKPAPSSPQAAAVPNRTTALRPEAGGSSRWVDNWGAEYLVTLAGDGYYFTASGRACRGAYTSQGTGVIRGVRVEVTYRSTFSVGTCIGTISGDGNRIVSDCRDSVCGPFRTIIDRR
jgi:serine/threonine protein kinase/peptidoglycan hydrolase-like protein with peptidoglycan-binding domain